MENHTICMIAHRGYSSKYHENTESAFIAAAKRGSGGIETDLRVTLDGELVCSHDGSVTFIDGTTLQVSESTLARLTEKPLKNKVSDEVVYLATFRRYLEICREYDLVCFIELKSQFTDEQIKQTFGTAAEVYDLSKCILQSFSFENLLRTREMFPDLQLMLTYGMGDEGWERCFDYGFQIDADYKIVTWQMIREFRRRGLKVGLWTANTEEALEFCRFLKVDYIESDVF